MIAQWLDHRANGESRRPCVARPIRVLLEHYGRRRCYAVVVAKLKSEIWSDLARRKPEETLIRRHEHHALGGDHVAYGGAFDSSSPS